MKKILPPDRLLRKYAKMLILTKLYLAQRVSMGITPEMDWVIHSIVDALMSDTKATAKSIAAGTGFTVGKVQYLLTQLEKQGLMLRKQTRDPKGRLLSTEYDLTPLLNRFPPIPQELVESFCGGPCPETAAYAQPEPVQQTAGEKIFSHFEPVKTENEAKLLQAPTPPTTIFLSKATA